MQETIFGRYVRVVRPLIVSIGTLNDTFNDKDNTKHFERLEFDSGF